MVLCYEEQDSFLWFVSLEEGLCPLLEFHRLDCVVNNVLRIVSLDKVSFLNVVMFSSNVLFEEFLQSPSLLPVVDTL